MKRTGAMVILAIIAGAAGLVTLFDTIRYLEFLFSPLSFVVTSSLGAILSGLIALIWFAAAVQIWNGDPRGWLFMVSIATFYLIMDVLALVAGTPFEWIAPSLFITVLALVLGLLPSTKREFGAG